MSLRLALAFLGLAVACAYGERVTCREVKKSDGSLGFDCASVVPTTDLTAQNLYILWLQSGKSGKDHALNIDVPNYQIQDVVQAAAKGGSGQSHTNINVNLARPEFSYTAQKEEKVGEVSQSFDVNLQYEKINGKSVHFADDGAGSERYAPLNGAIQEPSGSGSIRGRN
jgi:hypothetical protein